MEVHYPDPNGWNVKALNGTPTGGSAAEARPYAVCLGTKAGADIRSFQSVYFASQDVTVKAENGTARQSVSCGEGSYVLSGGSRTETGRSANVETLDSFPDAPGTWTAPGPNAGHKKPAETHAKPTA